MHLSDQTLVSAAQQYTADQTLCEELEPVFFHMADCPSCRKKFLTFCAIQQALRDTDPLLMVGLEVAQTLPVSPRVHAQSFSDAAAVFQISVRNAGERLKVSIRQLWEALPAWEFAPSLSYAAARGTEEDSPVYRVEAVENPEDYVSYNAASGTLRLRITPDSDTPLTASLCFPDGRRISVPLSVQGNSLTAVVHDLKEDSFRLILQ